MMGLSTLVFEWGAPTDALSAIDNIWWEFPAQCYFSKFNDHSIITGA
jgi:hypothetical protein